jgi:alkanesulfonate monooxygenase SsuD/methylene tetrahydromethanopterin reductase-like flavin-dependent oxidoreductase (luciferase family)
VTPGLYGDGVRVGLVILPQLRWQQQRDQWRRAEELGFDHAWTYDHLTWDPLVGTPWGATIPTLTAAALVTSRIRLGTWVASPNFRHPVPFARELAALDDVSEGRAVLGLGAGGSGRDATVLGDPVLSPADRAARLEEFVELLDQVLTRPSTTWRGRFYAAQDAATTLPCVQRPRLPFVIAANGPRTMRLAARFGAGWATTGIHRGRDSQVDDETWWSGVAGLAKRFDDLLAAAGRDPLDVDRMLSVDAAPTFALASLEKFTDVVGRAAELGFTDVVVHWPLPGAPVYDAPESVLDEVAAALPAVQSP